MTLMRLTLVLSEITLPLGLRIRDTWLRLTAFGHVNVGRANDDHKKRHSSQFRNGAQTAINIHAAAGIMKI